jgi:hypothetical protein
VVSNLKVGGGGAAGMYRHPLLSSISPYLESLPQMADPKARRKVRWTPVAAGTAAVLMALDPACALTVRCEDALECMGEDFRCQRRVGRTYNGLVKALDRQASAVLPVVKRDLRRRSREGLAAIRRTSGWILLAADGSKEELPRTVDHEKEFGIGDNGANPQALVTAIVEVHTGLPWDWRIGRASACEKNHLLEMVADLPDGALLLADGNFVGYPIWSALHDGGKQFLIRVGGNVGLLTGLWPEARIERHGDIVYAWPKARRGSSVPLRLRLIRVGTKAGPVFLLTNVLDHRRLSERAAGAIYRTRWGVELFYRAFKRTMGYAKLRSRSGRRARVELEWGLITATIVTLLGIAALRGRRRDPRRLSPAALVRALRAALLRGNVRRRGRAKRTLANALSRAERDCYTRRGGKQSRHRPVTRNTPKHHTLKPPRIRAATPRERQLAHTLVQALAA